MTPPHVTGVLLAAGAGRRFGSPKALVDTGDGPWVRSSCDVLLAGGCAEVLVVTGAGAEEVRALLDPGDHRVRTVHCAEWATGMGASLRTGLTALTASTSTPTDAALVHLVDLPDVGAAVVARVLAAAGPDAAGSVLVRATYGGRPGHPVLLGRDHWAGVAEAAGGDRGARAYLQGTPHVALPCDDLASGRDVDARSDLADGTAR